MDHGTKNFFGLVVCPVLLWRRITLSYLLQTKKKHFFVSFGLFDYITAQTVEINILIQVKNVYLEICDCLNHQKDYK